MNSILNKDTESTLFKRNVIKKGKERIDFFTQRDNQDKIIKGRDKQIFNLSLKEILENLSQTVIDLLTDIISGNIHSIGDLFKGDRILYLGILLFFVAMAIYIID